MQIYQSRSQNYSLRKSALQLLYEGYSKHKLKLSQSIKANKPRSLFTTSRKVKKSEFPSYLKFDTLQSCKNFGQLQKNKSTFKQVKGSLSVHIQRSTVDSNAVSEVECPLFQNEMIKKRINQEKPKGRQIKKVFVNFNKGTQALEDRRGSRQTLIHKKNTATYHYSFHSKSKPFIKQILL